MPIYKIGARKMKAFKDDNEARLYGRFYARLSKYPEIKAIYAQTDEQRSKANIARA